MKDGDRGESSSSGDGPSLPVTLEYDAGPEPAVEDLQELFVTVFSSPQYTVVPDDVPGALNARLRKGTAKKLGGKAVGAIPVQVAGFNVAGAVIAVPRICNTANVLGHLTPLIQGQLSDDAKEDIAYICEKKMAKMSKAELSMVAGVSTFVTAFYAGKGIGKALAGTKGAHRTDVATRILEKLQRNDPDYRAIVKALFANDDNPELWLYLLQVCPKAFSGLARRLLMRKIAS